MKKAILCLFYALSIMSTSAQSTDTELPVINCPGNIVVDTEVGSCNAIVEYAAPIGTDNEPNPITTLKAGLGSGGTFAKGSTTETYEVTDGAGLKAECSFTVTVNDVEPPTALCKTTTIQLDDFGNATLAPSAINNNSSDNCNQVILRASPDQFDCTHVGVPQLVTLTVFDRAELQATCTTTITVEGLVSIDNIVTTDESCAGAADGTIEIGASGSGPLEYSVDGGNTFQDEAFFSAQKAGDYAIVVRKASTNCVATKIANIAAGPICGLRASDPCVCLNNASPYDIDTDTGGGDGQFSEVVTISATQALPAGLKFIVIAPTTGVYDVGNIPTEGNQSAKVPVATNGSVAFTFNNGIYELAFVHNQAEGYSLNVALEVEGANSIVFQLGNTCFYPQAEITSILDGPFCAFSQPVELVGNAGGILGVGKFYINGIEATVFDPTNLLPGNYTIRYEFNAGAALGYQIENNVVLGPPAGAATLAVAEANPGCISAVEKTVEVIPAPQGFSCREQITVNLQENCQATLTPENLVGTLECVDLSGLFSITVADANPENNEVVDGCGNYVYTITGPNGFDCSGNVTAEDKQEPVVLDCPPTISGIEKTDGFQAFVCDDINQLLFNAPVTYTSDKAGSIQFDAIDPAVKTILDITGYATFIDNCGDLTITVTDRVEEGLDPDCEEVTILRTFVATDACQSLVSSVCSQEIIISKPDVSAVNCPEDVALDCAATFKLDDNGNPHPDDTGYPWLYTAFDLTDDDVENYKTYLDKPFCNVSASYTDGARIQDCAGTYKVVRTWQILDWCSTEVKTCQQIIKVGDTESPTVICEAVDYDNDGQADLRSYSTGPFDCTSSFQVPLPVVEDNCSSWEVLTEIVGFSTTGPVLAIVLPGQSRFVSGIPLGCHFIRYTVIDECGNKTVEYCPFVVEDRVEPIAICNDDLAVSIGGSGLARVFSDDIDDGSSDNCGIIRIEIRRRILAGTDYGCLAIFDYDGDGEIIGDEVNESPQFGDPDGNGVGQQFYYTPWSDFIDFTCCDVGANVRVELRVWDDRNGDGLAGNEIEKNFCGAVDRDIRDNYNVCWLDLLVEDKLPPICVPPLPVTVDCDQLPFNFDPADVDQMNDLFGEATGSDNCPEVTISELAPLTEGLNDCGYGSFIRRFSAVDAQGQASINTCQQIVTLQEQHYYKIKFPQDVEANCTDPQADSVLVEELACDLLAISSKDEFFSASGDECYKILRTYSVINWCEYDGISDPVVVSRDEDCDGIPGDEAVWVIVKTINEPDPCYDLYGSVQADYYQHVWYDRDNDPFNLLPEAGTKGISCDQQTNPFGFWKEVVPITENEAEEEDTDGYPLNSNRNHCADMASFGYWQYTQIIKVYDDTDPIVTYSAADPFCSFSSDLDNGCPAEVNLEFTIEEICTPDDLTITLFLDAFQDGIVDQEVTELLSGTYPNYTISGTFPLGAHYIGVSVEDGCGNQVGINIPFEVADCKAPSPICINGLAIELMPVFPAADVDGDGDLDNGAMAIWASDFIASPVTDCSEEVTYSINIVGEEAKQDQTGITLTCDSEESVLLEIWAWDGANNGDFCETYILVQDNMVQCDGVNNGGTIAGTIINEKLAPLAGADLALSWQQ